VRLKRSDAEVLQVFVDSHLAERWDQHWSQEFRWVAEQQSFGGIPVQIVAGAVPSDTGSSMDPNDFGPLELAPEPLSSAAAQGFLLGLCDGLASAPLFGVQGRCFLRDLRTFANRSCSLRAGSTGQAQDRCCEQSYPLPQDRFDHCVEELLADRGRYDVRNSYTSYDTGWGNGLLIGSNGALKAIVFGYFTTVAFTSKLDILESVKDPVEAWAAGALEPPAGVPRPFWISEPLTFLDLQSSLNTGALQACALAMGCCGLVLLLVVGNVVMAFLALACIFWVLVCVVASLMLFGWVLDVMTAVVLAICVGMCVDFVCHLSHAYTHAPKELCDGQELSWSEERAARVRYALGSLGISVTMGAITTLLGGLAMLPSQVKFFFQFGTFLAITMLWAFLFAIFYFTSLSAAFGIVGDFGGLGATARELRRRLGGRRP